jgi:hypothetical protein
MAAAAVLLILFWSRDLGPQDGSRYEQGDLLGAGIVPVAPTEHSATFEVFKWELADSVAVEGFELAIHRESEGTPGAELRHVSDLAQSEWRPAPGEREGWPETLMWRVEARNANGDAVAFSPWQVARRTPR